MPPTTLFVAAATLVPIYVSIRIYTTRRLPVLDCDEVFNYWEPLHFLLHHFGLQTWEYSHEHALRSYLYLLPLALLGRLLFDTTRGWDGVSDKVDEWMWMRGCLSGFTALCELYFLYSIYKLSSNQSVPFWTAALLLWSSGMSHAAGAFLPSSTWMAVWCLLTGLYLHNHAYLFVIVAVSATLTTGWPFGCVCVIPMAVHMLWEQCVCFGRASRFIGFILLTTAIVQSVTMYIDFLYYDQVLSTTWNILKYNAGASNDTLYGVEPFSYYVKNLLLNLNLVALLGCLALPIAILKRQLKQSVVFSCLLAWFSITLFRPHKEERFLFPIYPVLVWGAVFVIEEALLSFVSMVCPKPLQQKDQQRHDWYKYSLHALLWIPVLLVSLSRTEALQRYYQAPVQIYANQPLSGTVCVCGEWYRFPSSFFLKDHNLGFLKSSFTGQLPQPFSDFGSRASNAQPFNDQNKGNEERYIDPSQCRYVVDLDNGECVDQFHRPKTIVKFPFLNADRTSTIHRTLYIPFLHEQAVQAGQVVYDDYVLYKVNQ